jgi:membrane protease YdiL (CAAX protease family)
VALAALAALCAATALALIAQRVYAHERDELEFEGEAHDLAQLAHAKGSTPVSVRLAEVRLERGENALFELCSEDRLEAARWLKAFELVVFELPKMTLMLRVPLDDEHMRAVRRNASGACLTLGGGVIERAGTYSVDAVWPEKKPAADVMAVPLRARVLARRPLGKEERNLLAALAGSLLGLLVVMIAGRTEAETETETETETDAETGRRRRFGALAAAVVTLGAVYATTRVPTAGALATLAKGVVLIALQVGGPLLFMRFATAGSRSLPARPRGTLLRAYLLALAAALALWGCAKLALLFVPATGEAPIQTFVAWPSGMLCFAALGLLLPIGEELFFRGLLFHALLRAGQGVLRAAALSWLLFVVLHAEQSWGNWGGLVSIAAAGVVLTGLRVATESVLVPALAHVLYNFALSAGAF